MLKNSSTVTPNEKCSFNVKKFSQLSPISVIIDYKIAFQYFISYILELNKTEILHFPF